MTKDLCACLHRSRLFAVKWAILLFLIASSYVSACPACRGNVDVLREFAKVERQISAAEERSKLRAIKKGTPSGTIANAWAKKEAVGGMHAGTLFAHMILTDTWQRLELRFHAGSARVSPASEKQPEVLFITSLSTLDAINRGRCSLEDAIAEGWFATIDPALTSGDRK